MARETVTDYETVEKEREVYISDLSGREIPEEDRVEMHINPRGRGRRAKSDGAVHATVDELAELLDLETDDIRRDETYPEFYVKGAQPEVIDRSLIPEAACDVDSMSVALVLLSIATTPVLWHLAEAYPGQPGTALFLLVATLLAVWSIITFFAALILLFVIVDGP